jgi:hypothetical protein
MVSLPLTFSFAGAGRLDRGRHETRLRELGRIEPFLLGDFLVVVGLAHVEAGGIDVDARRGFLRMRGVVVDLAVNFLNGDSTGTFICLKVALTLLWATSVLSTAAPAARVVPNRAPAMALRVNFMVSPSKGTAGQHAAHGAVAVDDSVFQGGRHVQGDDGGHGHVEPVVHDLQDSARSAFLPISTGR